MMSLSQHSEVSRDFFISRAGEDAEISSTIDQILRDAGYTTFLQDRDFGHASFMERMAEGFRMVEGGSRLIALLSSNYQRKPHCLKEARFPLIDDAMNTRERLIVFRVDECKPADFLKDIRYVDLVRYLNDPLQMADVVLQALASRHLATGRARSDIGHDSKVERLLLFLENEDEDNPEKALNYLAIGVLIIAALLIAFDYFIDLWNWLWGTQYYVLFPTSFVIPVAIVCLGALTAAGFFHIRNLAKAIEDARLTSSQIRALRERILKQQWRSKAIVKAAMTLAIRNMTIGSR